MKAILFHEAICPEGTEWDQRLGELADEAVLAEENGFHAYAQSEQHFAKGEAIISAPEIGLAYVAARTKKIKLRISSVNLLPYNHPLRVVEQAAMLDMLSGGRFELGGARSNNPYTLEAFQIDPSKTRQYRDEFLEIIGKALTNEWFEHKSQYYDIPKRRISPWMPSRRPIPVHISTTSTESHQQAGAAGCGAMSGLSILGWDYVANCLEAYNAGTAEAKPTVGSITSRFATFTVGTCCHEDAKQAREITRKNTVDFLKVIIGWMTKLGQTAEGYEYMSRIEEIRERCEDIDFLVKSSPYIMAGDPEEILATARRLYDMGVDDVIWRVDGMGHENNKATIEMLGKHVIPTMETWPDRRPAQRFGASL
jgi:alkanesulfonate monooxygenase SsuD/methylene tetrahydromethanopterin reductase-like flavin-dependent oxidoreductase (luciferase family)